jgi:two-component system sensor kinase FixL
MASLSSLYRSVFLACVICSPLPAQEPVAAPDRGGMPDGRAEIRAAPALAQAIASTEKTQADFSGKKSVLFLNSYHPGYEWSDEVYEAIHSVLDGEKFNLLTEYLDSQHYEGKEYTDFLEKLLRYKYGNSKIDAIVASDHYAVKLALAMRGTFQRGVPLVYLGIDKFIWGRREEYKPIYGLEEEDGGVFGTLDLVFSIHRNVKLIYLVADGDAESAPVMLNYVREVERSGKSRAIFKYLVGMSMEEVEAAVRAAPPDSVVVWLHFMKDKNGRLMSVTESQKWLAGISPVPVYCPYGFQPGSGVMGGQIISGLAQGKRAAEIVLQILEGRAPQLFYGTKAPFVTKLDYQVMRRFGIGMDDIPADSVMYNKPSSVFQKYRTQILGALTLIFVLSAIVVYLLLSLARRKKAEKALSESEERMTVAVDAAEFGIWGWDITRNQVWGSERWQRQFGFASDEDVSFEKVIQRIHPDDRETVEREVRYALVNGRNYAGEFRAVLPDGTQRWIVSRGRAYLDANRKPSRMVGAAMDITERKQAQAELAQLQRRSELILNSAAEGILGLDLQGNHIFVNPAAGRMLGYKAEELIGRHSHRCWHHTRPDGSPYPEEECKIYASFADGQVHRESDEVFWRKDGTSFPVEYASTPILEQGRLLGAVVTFEDITERRQAELESRRTQTEIAHLSRVAMLGELSGSLAHELNQPLASILINAQAAQRTLALDPINLQEVRDIIADIVADDNRASEVISRLRLLLKKGEMKHQSLKVNEIVREVLKLLGSDLTNQGVTAHAVLARDLPLVCGDQVQFQQVLLNLVMNACDAMANVEHAARQLMINTDVDGAGDVHISVTDSGTGIAPELLERIFEPFHTTKSRGLGLGLAVCRTIVTAHRGKLWATNNPERGAAFHFTLPAEKR